jgi:hypothetical protein
MRQIRNIAILAGVAALVGCATEAPSPAAQTQPVAVHTVLADPAAKAAAAPASKMVLPQGYTRIMTDDGERFCREERDTASRLAKQTVCLTAEQLKESEDSAQKMMEEMTRHNASGFNGGRTN